MGESEPDQSSPSWMSSLQHSATAIRPNRQASSQGAITANSVVANQPPYLRRLTLGLPVKQWPQTSKGITSPTGRIFIFSQQVWALFILHHRTSQAEDGMTLYRGEVIDQPEWKRRVVPSNRLEYRCSSTIVSHDYLFTLEPIV